MPPRSARRPANPRARRPGHRSRRVRAGSCESPRTCAGRARSDDWTPSPHARYHYRVRITVLYFAVFRERLGHSDETIELADGATVETAIATLAAMHAPVAKLAGRFRVAVNQDF